MKRYLALLLTLLLALSLFACGEPQKEDNLTAEEKKELAISCIDKTTEELFDLIGEPENSDYVPSCLNPDGGAEDGELHYDGFIVYTYKEGDSETVIDVE